MDGHKYDNDGYCIKCGCKRNDLLYPEGSDCPYDAWVERGYTDES